MTLLALGVDHRTAPPELRESIAFDGPRCARGLEALAGRFPGTEFALLSTCNRVELYAAAESAPPDADALAWFLARFHDVPVEGLRRHLVARRDAAAVEHLFRVAAGLESLVLGEGQILGQVRDAYRLAAGRGAVGPVLHQVFQRALRVGKRARAETGLGRGRTSVASVAVDVARAVFDRLDDKAVLVIGAGVMGELALQHLAALRPGALLLANRDPARARAVAERRGGRAVAFERLDDALVAADVVVSATAAAGPIVTADRYARLQRARGHRLALILDLAVPRDFGAGVGELDQVLLYNVDDLRAQAERNLRARHAEAERAGRIVAAEAAACLAALWRRREVGALLRRLGDATASRRAPDPLLAAEPDPTLADAPRTILPAPCGG
ncbi:MAG TPA: glutamyl-tRNA reductase [Isosphaeraceae bacterium]|jgi:glutamyl-tRNA reductase|nr:glutamyl-tRNA reductase [Isosphaeraceae bacterium]